MQGDYVTTWVETVKNGFFFPTQPWVDFKRSIEHVFKWSDALAAARVRTQATGEGLTVPPHVATTIERLVVEADAEEDRGKLPDPVWRHRNESVLDDVARATPWLGRHQELVNPFIVERAKVVQEIEQTFLTERAKSLARVPRSIPIYRVEMLKRNAVGEINEVAKQVQLREPEIGDRFPWAFYDTRDDRRVRPTHKTMQDFVALRTWAGWGTIRPKNGYNCRCTTIFYTARQGIERGWADAAGKPKFEVKWPNSAAETNYNKGAFPDPGWQGPGKFWTP